MIVKVCDSIPGSGKTEAAIAMMNANPDKKYIFVTPYLKEADRIQASCGALSFAQPEELGWYYKKIDSLHDLLKAKKNVAHTHALFAYYSEETRQLIQDAGYTLILDEVMNVINKVEISKEDIEMLLAAGWIVLDEDQYSVRWVKGDIKGKYAYLKAKADLHNLFMSDTKMLYWTVPARSFDCFADVYILTYLFQAQLQRCYYETNGVEFQYIGVNKTDRGYEFGEYGVVPDYARSLIDRVHIFDMDKFNHIGEYDGGRKSKEKTGVPFGSHWFRLQRKRKEDSGKKIPKGGDAAVARNAMDNVLRNYFNAKASDTIWTTFIEQQKFMEGVRYKNRFVPCNARATNEYRHCHYLAYCVNVFLHPDTEKFLIRSRTNIDEDIYALSEMIQWVWRSAIRCGEDIWIYIPSTRMRDLFVDWLEALAVGRDVALYHAEKQKERKDAQDIHKLCVTSRKKRKEKAILDAENL